MQDICDEYFRSINILAKLISTDIDETKEAYQDLWDTLTAEEKCQALDDAIIHPDALLKYSIYEDEEIPDLKAYHQHSWFSKSQQNLSCAVNLQVTKPLTILKSPNRRKEVTKLPIANFEQTTLETKQQQSKQSVESISLLNKIKNKVYTKMPAADEERELLCEAKTQICIVPKGSVLKPKNPPPPPPTAKVSHDEESSLFSSFENLNMSVSSSDCKIPKTGFDFLDNW